MTLIVKVVLTIVVFIISIFLFSELKLGTVSYSSGIFLLIIIASSFACVITIWCYKPESIKSKDIKKTEKI